MRVVKIAKILGISTQDLRKYLGEINFGIKPNEKEVNDSLAQGIIRFLSKKYNLKIKDITDEWEEGEGEEEDRKEKLEGKVLKEKDNEISGLIKKISEQESLSRGEREKRRALKFEEKKKENIRRAEKYLKKRGIKRPIKMAPIESLAVEHSFAESEEKRKEKRPHKKVKILRRLTTEELHEVDEKIFAEEERIEKALEKERFKEQKRHRAKSLVAKKDVKEQIQIKEKKGVVELPAVITVKEFAEKTGIQVPRIIGELIKNGIMATINHLIDYDTAAIVADELGIKVKKEHKEATTEELFSKNLEFLLKEDDSTALKPRPPIVTIMGHVDHGKTKLLDYIRKTNVVASEAGGITQHIGAYQVEYKNKKITFLDTPGHEAFTAMRARGAKVTDIVVLVVAADESVKPQTREALNHAREAEVPIIVAINKIDKKEANIDKVKGDLAKEGLTPEEWGGKTIMVPLSALTGKGVDALLEMILLVADMENLKANPSRPAIATVIESHLDPSLGPIATVIVNTGTLKEKDCVIVGSGYGKIRALKDFTGKNLKTALPSTPVRLAGFKTGPHTGDILQVVKNEKIAKEKLGEMIDFKKKREKIELMTGMEEIIKRIKAGQLKYLCIVLKVDTKGSLEAIRETLAKINSEEVAPKIIHGEVGDITETDVIMAAASKGIVIGFHVDASSHVRKTGEKEGVEILIYDVIYKLAEEVSKILTGLLEPELVEVELGQAQILKIFMASKNKMIVGCRVLKGKIENGSKITLLRQEEGEKKEKEIGEGKIISLKSVNEVVKEMKEGTECGVQIESATVLQEGDTLVCKKTEKRMRTL